MTGRHQQFVSILTYHSISEGSAPTCISPVIFRSQLDVLENCGYEAISLARLANWLRGEAELTRPSFVLTFDDGFMDFLEVALPELQKRNWNATLFIPSGKVGGVADWETNSTKRLMSWSNIRDAASQGITIGAHGVQHVDLTQLGLATARDEIVSSKRQIENELGSRVNEFAAPFGRANQPVRKILHECFDIAVGTDLAQTCRESDVHHLPRIDMYYFQNARRWNAYLSGRGRVYFKMRQHLRRIRELVMPG